MTQYQAAIEVRAKAGLYDVENIIRREHAALVLADAILSGASDLARVTAERNRLRAACETVLAWYDRNFDHTGDEDDVATLKTVREALNQQPEN